MILHDTRFFPIIKDAVNQHGSSIKYGVLIPGEDELV